MSISENGRAIIPYGTTQSNMSIYYTNDNGNTWDESNITWSTDGREVRGGYITRNGNYAIFFVSTGVEKK